MRDMPFGNLVYLLNVCRISSFLRLMKALTWSDCCNFDCNAFNWFNEPLALSKKSFELDIRPLFCSRKDNEVFSVSMFEKYSVLLCFPLIGKKGVVAY